MARLRTDIEFGSAFISTPGGIVRQSGDLVLVTKGPVGVYDLDWREACAPGGIQIVAFAVVPTGDVPIMVNTQAVAGFPNRIRVNLWFDDTVTGIPTHLDNAFTISGTRISTN